MKNKVGGESVGEGKDCWPLSPLKARGGRVYKEWNYAKQRLQVSVIRALLCNQIIGS